MASPRGGTRERILNAAERLFADRGFDGTSTRAIVAASGDTIGSVNYHFGSKEKLLREVVQRRFDAMAEARRIRYREAQALAGPHGLTVEAVVDAIVTPYLDRSFRGGRGWRSYTQLIGALLFSPKAFHKFLVAYEGSHEFMDWLACALPGADPGDVAYAYQFMVGCMIEASMESPVDRVATLTGGRQSSNDFDSIAPRLVRFIAAGIVAVVTRADERAS